MKHLTKVRQGLGAGVIGLSVTLGLLGPAAAPALAAADRPTLPATEVIASSTTPTGTSEGTDASTGATVSGATGSSSSNGGTAVARSKRPQLSLTQVTPTSLTYQDDLVITGKVNNPGIRAVRNLKVALRFNYNALRGRDAVTQWLDKGDVALTSATLTQVTVPQVAAGGSASFQITVPARSIGLAGFGPRPFALVATSKQGRQLDVLRSTVVWAPKEADEKIGLTLLAALTSAAPSTTAGLPTEEAAAELLPTSRLSNIISASDALAKEAAMAA